MAASEKPNLVSAVRAHAREKPEFPVITWLDGLAEPGTVLTYTAVDDQAAAVAATLAGQTGPGDRVLLVHLPGPEFVPAFLGCLYAGRIPVPVYPDLGADGLETIRRIGKDSGARAVLVADPAIGDRAQELLGLPAVLPHSTERARPSAPSAPDDLAFLQYTSGSTAAPKGVEVRHGALLANVRAIAEAFEHRPGTPIVSWLPVYHDMGLIGNILHALHLGCRLHLGSPMDFSVRPLTWLEAISRYGAHTAGGPNFAYELAARAVERHGLPEGLDLSGWSRAYSGAEQVRPATLERFTRAVAPAGFRPSAFIPCYGLAEATLLVSSVTPGRGVRTRTAADGMSAVSCGPARDCRIRIADEQGRALPDGEVGEIAVAGPSVTTGYWNQPEATAATFLPADADSDRVRWLRTGDLGFLAEGELHVAGRVKDVFTVRGRNIYPQDVEALAADTVAALRPGSTAAFSDGGGGVVVVAEARPGAEVTEEDVVRLRAAIVAARGVRLSELVLVDRGAVPKTTSGKLRRAECAERYRNGTYDAHRLPTPAEAPSVAAGTPGEPLEELRHMVADALVLDDGPPPAQASLTSLGLDSLGAVRLRHTVEERWGVLLPLPALLSGPTIADLADHLASQDAPAEPPATLAAPPDGRPSRAQEALAFLHMLEPDGDAYTISHAVELPEDVDLARFRRAVRAAFLRHPELAVTLSWTSGTLRRTPAATDAVRDALALVPVPVREERLDESLADAAAAPFSPEQGPLFRLHLWRSPRRTVLQLSVHHTVADLWSLCLLLRDVARCYADMTTARVPARPSVAPYDVYVRAQEDYLASEAAQRRAADLAARLPRRAGPLGVRTDRPRGPRRSRRGARVTDTLPPETTELLIRTGPVPLLTAVWGLCLQRYGTPAPVVVGVPDAGRPTAALAEVVGLCTNTVPLAVDARDEQPLEDLLADVREQVHAGMAHGLHPLSSVVEAVSPDREPGRQPLVETMVAYFENPLPEIEGLTEVVTGRPGPVRIGDLRLRNVPIPRNCCRYDLDLVVAREQAGHRLVLDYAADLFDAETAAALLATFRAMVEAAGRPGARVADLFVLSTRDREHLEQAGTSYTPPLTGTPAQAVHAVATADPGRPAIRTAERDLDFAEFADRVRRLGRVLHDAAREDA